MSLIVNYSSFPGAIGAWPKKNVVESGYLSEDTLAEDTDRYYYIFTSRGIELYIERKSTCLRNHLRMWKSLIKTPICGSYGTLNVFGNIEKRYVIQT